MLLPKASTFFSKSCCALYVELIQLTMPTEAGVRYSHLQNHNCCCWLAPHCVSYSGNTRFPGAQIAFRNIGQLSQLTSLILTCDQDVQMSDSMKGLSKLRQLTLHNIAPNTFLSELPDLVELVTSAGMHAKIDVSGCTQLTSLEASVYTAYRDLGFTVLLPAGQKQSLQRIVIQDKCHVQGLQAATALTSLAISTLAAQLVQWPSVLPALQILTVLPQQTRIGHLPLVVKTLPCVWQHYSTLTHLDLHSYHAKDLPSWFGALQQLKSLTMLNLELSVFPRCLLRLSQLEELKLTTAGPAGKFSDGLVNLASLPCLKSLYICFIDNVAHQLEPDPNEAHFGACNFWEELSDALYARPLRLLPIRTDAAGCWWTVAERHQMSMKSVSHVLRALV